MDLVRELGAQAAGVEVSGAEMLRRSLVAFRDRLARAVGRLWTLDELHDILNASKFTGIRDYWLGAAGEIDFLCWRRAEMQGRRDPLPGVGLFLAVEEGAAVVADRVRRYATSGKLESLLLVSKRWDAIGGVPQVVGGLRVRQLHLRAGA